MNVCRCKQPAKNLFFKFFSQTMRAEKLADNSLKRTCQVEYKI